MAIIYLKNGHLMLGNQTKVKIEIRTRYTSCPLEAYFLEHLLQTLHQATQFKQQQQQIHSQQLHIYYKLYKLYCTDF